MIPWEGPRGGECLAGHKSPPGAGLSFDRPPPDERAFALREVSRKVLSPYADHFRALTSCGLPGRLTTKVEFALYEPEEGEELPVAVAKGLLTCGSSWACPVCSPREALGLAHRLERVVARLAGQGWRVAMATLTVRHERRDSLEATFGALSSAWRWLVSHYRVKGHLRHTLWFRGTEITFGPNGWHPHLHLLLVFPPGRDPWALEDPLWEAWAEAVERVGWKPSERAAYHYLVPEEEEAAAAALASYAAEAWGLAPEAAGGPLKGARVGLSPFALLEVAEGEEAEEGALETPGTMRRPPWLRPGEAAYRWVEYAEATKGRRRWGASRSLSLLLRAEEEEEEAARRARKLLEVVYLSLPAYIWLLRSRRLAYWLWLARHLGFSMACRLVGLVEGVDGEWWAPSELVGELARALAPPGGEGHAA
ncbi:protein rep [Thermus sp.]|uniref:protein rep n=1 Tax=Thermus sp. TaxID=275 RepID=UPI003D114F9C